MVLESSDTIWTKTKQLSSYVSSRVFRTSSSSRPGQTRREAPQGPAKSVMSAGGKDSKRSECSIGNNASTARLIKEQSSLDLPDEGFKKNESFISEEFASSGCSEGDEEDSRGEWDNPIEFLLSCLSFAVGLGNIWRFPYLCYRNGGGAFLIPYVISLIFMGLPVFLFEMGAGQFGSVGPIEVWKICPLFQGIGYAMCCLSLYIGTYYNIILSWAFFYIFSSFTTQLPWASCGNWWNTEACRRFDSKNCTAHGGLMANEEDCVFPKDVTIDVWKKLNETAMNAKMPSDEFFHFFMLDISKGIHEIGSIRIELAGCLLIAWIIVYCALWKGIKSFGKLVYFTALFPYAILIILLIRAATLPGYVDGITFYLTPQWEKLLDIDVWADACIQIFFSLGVTWGGMITLASYNKFRNNVFRDAVMVAVGNCCTSFFAGFVIFGIIGFMAHELGVKVEDVAAQGAGLAFIAYPEAVSRMPISPLWSILFFLMLLSLGFGTQFSTTETVITIILDRFPRFRGKNRRWCTLAVCGCMYLAGLSMITEGGMYILQLVDNHSATYSALILGCAEISVMAWIYGVDQFLDDLKFMLGRYPYPRIYWKWAWKVIAPTIVVGILICTWRDYSGNTYGIYDYPNWANFAGWAITFSSVICIPIVAIYKVCQEEGPIFERIKNLAKPSPDWGPASPRHKQYDGARKYDAKFKGLKRDVEGSNMTLITNASQSTITAGDVRDNNVSQLEPLKEAYEEDPSSDEEGLNMRVIIEDKNKDITDTSSDETKNTVPTSKN